MYLFQKAEYKYLKYVPTHASEIMRKQVAQGFSLKTIFGYTDNLLITKTEWGLTGNKSNHYGPLFTRYLKPSARASRGILHSTQYGP